MISHASNQPRVEELQNQNSWLISKNCWTMDLQDWSDHETELLRVAPSDYHLHLEPTSQYGWSFWKTSG